MLNLLQVCLDSDKMQPVIYTPTVDTIGIQLNYVKNGIIVDVSTIPLGYSVKIFEMPQGAQKPVIKAVFQALSRGGKDDGESSEWDLCNEIFDKYFGKDEQMQVADHFALIINGKNVVKANK